MTRSLRVAARVWKELEEAIIWYEEQRDGLGMELAEAVEEAFSEIVEAPERWPRWQEGAAYRRRVLTRFPYAVFYVVNAGVVRILAVAHTKRQPGYWLR